mgnify:CR=1 FL=1
MESQQKKALVDLLEYLRHNNDYYEKRIPKFKFDLECSINEILSKIPIISREDINYNIESYLSKSDDFITYELTSGTTGEPFRCYKTKQERMLLALAEWKCRKEWDVTVRNKTFFPLMGVNDKYSIDFANYSDDNIQKIFKAIAAQNAEWLCGSPSTLYNYAKKIEDKVVEPIDTLKFIELQGEYADIFVRKYIEDRFKCRTIMHYGNRECWAMAYECPSGSMHVMDNVILENIYDENDNPIIVTTNLIAKKMPFLRYNTGDVGIVSRQRCSCGKQGLVVELLGGRRANTIYGYDAIGDIVFKKIIHNVINKERISKDIIRHFRVEQREKNLFVYYLDKGLDFEDIYYQEITERTREALDGNVRVIFADYISKKKKYKIFETMIKEDE